MTQQECSAQTRYAADLVDHSSHELWVWLLIRQELSDDLVHDILWWEEVVQKLWQDSGHHPGLAGQTFTDSADAGPEVSVRLPCTAKTTTGLEKY